MLPDRLAVVSELVEVALQRKDLSRSCSRNLVTHHLACFFCCVSIDHGRCVLIRTEELKRVLKSADSAMDKDSPPTCTLCSISAHS